MSYSRLPAACPALSALFKAAYRMEPMSFHIIGWRAHGMRIERLAGKFNQSAELRNGIRHSRTVDEVARKEGEAAILWFEKVLGS